MNGQLKEAVRRLVRPWWRKIWSRVEARLAPVESRLAALDARLGPVEARVAALDARLGPVESHLAALDARAGRVETGLEAVGARAETLAQRLAPVETGWREHSPAFQNAVATIPALSHQLVQTKNGLHEEIRGLRADLLRGHGPLEKPIAALEDEVGRLEPLLTAPPMLPRVHSPQKLADVGADGLRLNLGCGRMPLGDYVNVDWRDLPGVDIVAELDNMPAASGSVREIFSSHILQCFSEAELSRRLLPYWRDLLANGGEFRALVPDAEAMVAGIAEGKYAFDDFRRAVLDGEERDGCPYHNLFAPRHVVALLQEAGFDGVEVARRGGRDGKSCEFEIVGFKR